MSRKNTGIDLWLLLTTVILLGIGLVMIYSASYTVAKEKFGSVNFFVLRHLLRILLGFIGLYIAMNLDYHKWAKIDRLLIGVGLFFLVFVLLHPGSAAINGAKRWIRLGGFSFQPSEFVKLALVLFMARALSEKQEKLSSFSEGLLPQLFIPAVIVILIAVEPNYSTAMVILLIAVSMVYIAGARIPHLFTLGASLIPVLYLFLLRAPYRRARIMAFLEPNSHAQNIGYQAYQALIGFGAGGIWGTGLGASRQKLFYLPEPYTDFVFAVIGEELGFIGVVAILAMFGVIAWRGIRIARRAPDAFGSFLGFGITAVIVIYVLFHVGVATSLLPTTGIPLPFLSYGGMSIVFTMIAIGILLNISGQAGVAAFPKEKTSPKYSGYPLRRESYASVGTAAGRMK